LLVSANRKASKRRQALRLWGWPLPQGQGALRETFLPGTVVRLEKGC